jgi:hypothetical protein
VRVVVLRRFGGVPVRASSFVGVTLLDVAAASLRIGCLRGFPRLPGVGVAEGGESMQLLLPGVDWSRYSDEWSSANEGPVRVVVSDQVVGPVVVAAGEEHVSPAQADISKVARKQVGVKGAKRRRSRFTLDVNAV